MKNPPPLVIATPKEENDNTKCERLKNQQYLEDSSSDEEEHWWEEKWEEEEEVLEEVAQLPFKNKSIQKAKKSNRKKSHSRCIFVDDEAEEVDDDDGEEEVDDNDGEEEVDDSGEEEEGSWFDVAECSSIKLHYETSMPTYKETIVPKATFTLSSIISNGCYLPRFVQ